MREPFTDNDCSKGKFLASSIERNKKYLADLFVGPFRGHAIIVDPELPELGCWLSENEIGSAVLITAWMGEQSMMGMLDQAEPESRFFLIGLRCQ